MLPRLWQIIHLLFSSFILTYWAHYSRIILNSEIIDWCTWRIKMRWIKKLMTWSNFWLVSVIVLNHHWQLYIVFQRLFLFAERTLENRKQSLCCCRWRLDKGHFLERSCPHWYICTVVFPPFTGVNLWCIFCRSQVGNSEFILSMVLELKHRNVESEFRSLLVGLSSDTIDGEKYLAALSSSTVLIVELFFEVILGWFHATFCVHYKHLLIGSAPIH